MRISCLLLSIYGILFLPTNGEQLSSAISKMEPYSTILRGQVESIELNNVSSSGVTVVVKLKLELLNNGATSIIFLAAEPSLLVGATLAKSPVDSLSGKNLIMEYAGPGVDTSPKWAMLRKSLDQSYPPYDKVRILKPNESWKLEDSVGISMPTESGKNNIHFPKRESWEVIQKASPVWLRVICEVWPLNLEPSSSDRTELKFGHKLQRRWERDGFLLLKPLYSDPLKLDLQNIKQ